VAFFLAHSAFLRLPYFWDEHGQFIPTALDLFRRGLWVAHSTVPNIHPPGVEVYLVLWYKAFGYSIAITRLAMLVFASAGLLLTFLLARELNPDAGLLGTWLPSLLLAVSPLFYMQSMMALLDMPAAVLTLLVLVLFLGESYIASSIAAMFLVLAKETAVVTPCVLFALLCWRRQIRQALFYVAAPAALAIWLVLLHHATGYWTGDPGFEHYNVGYSLHPVRIGLNVLRRIYYLFFAEFRWIGTLAIVTARTQLDLGDSPAWRTVGLVSAANLAIVTLLGGAQLERYLLPVLPLLYILMVRAISRLLRPNFLLVSTGLIIGLAVSTFWNPPYPFPYENNYAMVDFVRLQQTAAHFIETHFPEQTVATAWPYTAALRNPDFGFVTRPVQAVETNDFDVGSIRSIHRASYNLLAVYTRTWTPELGVTQISWIRRFLEKYYEFEPQISDSQCAELGLSPLASWERRGQRLTLYGFTQSDR
jgi:hypothetical protein